MNRVPARFRLAVCVLSLSSLPLAAGCHLFRSSSTGTKWDPAPDHPHDAESKRKREIVVEVTTDREGNVAQINIQRSSGKPGVDAYVAESIRQGWPRQPSTRSVASLTYSPDDGFSAPKVLSNTPVP